MNKPFSQELFDRIPIIGIMRNIPAQKTGTIATLYAEAGLTNLEITMNTAAATETITMLAKAFGDRLNIGAGTVCSTRDLETALAAGAQFIVTPVMNEDIIKACVNSNIPVFPGAYTPTEIYRAWSLGASMVKVFPATQLGPAYIREVLGPLNHIRLMPTGGIDLDNLHHFLDAGAKGLGIGGYLFPKDLIAQDSWDELRSGFSAFVDKYRQWRQS